MMNYAMRIVTLYRTQGSRPSPRKKEMQKSKWLSEEALQIAVKRKDVKSKGEKERYSHLNAEFQRLARKDKRLLRSLSLNRLKRSLRDKKDFLSDQ